MKIDPIALKVFAKLLIGAEQLMPYLSRQDLTHFFAEIGHAETHGQGASSRTAYAFETLQEFNGTPKLRAAFDRAFDRRRFYEHSLPPHVAVDRLNPYLSFDGYQLVQVRDHFVVRELEQHAVAFDASGLHHRVNRAYIEEQIAKSEKKIAEGDYDGAITNARTLLEAVLLELEKLLTGKEVKNDGELPALYKRVQKELNLEPSRKDISESLKQVLSGLNSIVNGLASMRNKMSDAHAAYKPAKHHAKLAVNAAKTMADFLFETYAYQQAKRKP